MKPLTNMHLSHTKKKIDLENGDRIILIDITENKSLQAELGMKNIFRINSNNEIIWQINIPDDVGKIKDTFMYVDINNEGNLDADTFFGVEYLIDIKTGFAKRIGWHK